VDAAGQFGLAIRGYVWVKNYIIVLVSPLYAGSIGSCLKRIAQEGELTMVRDATKALVTGE